MQACSCKINWYAKTFGDGNVHFRIMKTHDVLKMPDVQTYSFTEKICLFGIEHF